jgi:hypothetical protein
MNSGTPGSLQEPENAPSPGGDSYSKLIVALKNSGSLSLSIFGSLNYDCLFEQAA